MSKEVIGVEHPSVAEVPGKVITVTPLQIKDYGHEELAVHIDQIVDPKNPLSEVV